MRQLAVRRPRQEAPASTRQRPATRPGCRCRRAPAHWRGCSTGARASRRWPGYRAEIRTLQRPRGFDRLAAAARDLVGRAASGLLERLAPPSIVVNGDHEIAASFRSMPGASCSSPAASRPTNLLRSVHPMLRIELRAALYQAAQSATRSGRSAVPVEMDGGRVPRRHARGAGRRLARDVYLRGLRVRARVPRRRSRREAPPPSDRCRSPAGARARAAEVVSCATPWSSTKPRPRS